MTWTVTNSNIGTGSGKATTSVVLTTANANLAVGTLLVVAIACSAAAGTTSLVDSRGNTYTRFGTDSHQIAYSFITTGVNIGDTITLSWTNSATAAMAAAAFIDDGVGAAIDAHAPQTTGNNTTPSNSVTPAGSGELVIATVGVAAGNTQTFGADFTNTNGGAWNPLQRIGTTGGSVSSNQTLNWAYKITTATGTQTWAPGMPVAEPWNEDIYAWSPGSAATSTQLVMVV